MKRIQLIPHSLRPREKLLRYGPEALSEEELISVIFITGTRKAPVSSLAQKVHKLLQQSHTLSLETLRLSLISPSKTAQILAALELGKRHSSQKVVTFTSPQYVFAHSYEIIQQEKEFLICFYLNARDELLKKETVAMGNQNRVNLLPRDLFSPIKELPITSIILVHNHPSGNLEASEADLLFTKRIKAAGDIIGIKLLDHLIVSQQGWKKIPLSSL